ncbi:hypothetical protein T4A_704 [Trichinella pseudospiralis]|uniref:Uncharacterized protein n=1 Tax=Trichinella pseudospiralis TaxID=6337 RepID=A0A0V1F1U6_TRIPS|nr:hypothetical protein T4A_704 [Trichinella pseudospiralis]
MLINLAQPQETGRTSLDADATATRQRTFGSKIFPKATNQNNRTADSCGMAKIFVPAEGMMFKVENENGFEIIDAYSSA